MALKICPDCGKKVSSRAAMCPECGCPSEFFEDFMEANNADGNTLGSEETEFQKRVQDANVNANDIQVEEESGKKIPEEQEEVLASFTILGRTISYPQRVKTYIELIRKHQDDELRFMDVLEEAYDKAGDLDKAWKNVPILARAQAEVIIEDNLKMLYGLGYNVPKQYFLQNGADIEPYIQQALENYNNVLEAEEALKIQREYERAGRSKWTGGGFGIRGALKGAAKAAALNAVTGVGRAIGDSAVNTGDKANVALKKKELYKDKETIRTLSFALYQVSATADWLAAALYSGGNPTIGLSFERVSATRDYNAAVQYEKNAKSLAQTCISILEKYPLILGCYSKILEVIPFEDIDARKEVYDMIDFWNASYFFKDDISEFGNTLNIRDFLEQNAEIAAWESDFNTISFNSYIKAEIAAVRLRELYGADCLTFRHHYTKNLKRFFDECRNSNVFRGHLTELISSGQNSDPQGIVSAIHNVRQYLPDLLKGIWIKGDKNEPNTTKLLTKWKLPVSEKVYFFKNSAIFGTLFGGVGYLVTDHYICDLKSNAVLKINSEMVILKAGKDSIRISSKDKLITLNLEEQDQASKDILLDAIRIMRDLECKSEDDSRSQNAVKAFERMHDHIYEYAKTISDRDADSYLEDFLIRHRVNPRKQKNHFENNTRTGSSIKDNGGEAKVLINGQAKETVFCTFCGKKIMKKSKFCNFCGNINKYSI